MMQLSKFIICLWGLWKARNSLVFMGKHLEARKIIFDALMYLEHYLHIMEVSASSPFGLDFSYMNVMTNG